MFTEKDKQQIKEHGIDPKIIEEQIEHFRSGFPPSILIDAALEGNGLHILNNSEIEDLIKFYDENKMGSKILKFVPASGAATRMFKTLFEFLNEYTGSEEDYERLQSNQSSGSVFTFLKRLEDFAFNEDLKEKFKEIKGISLEEAQLKRDYASIIDVLLSDEGLGYGNLPKGLLKFHQYGNSSRTPAEEHLYEGANYAVGTNNEVNIHFTVSPEHLEKFKSHINKVKEAFEKEFGVHFNIEYSIQKKSTDTIAVDLNNEPFRNDDGSLLFRPAGHGALLDNLNELDADIVFIKNIDNVVPDRLKDETIKYKKVLAGLLLKYKDEIKNTIAKLKQGKGLDDAVKLLRDWLGYRPPNDFASMSEEQKISHVITKLNRPLRICGVVQSEGDPGGGPFWVQAEDGSISLQIVETAQMNLDDPKQKEVFLKVTHFNPVDVVAYLKDVDGKPFDLMAHRDMSAGFISKKSKDGKDLKAQELPGLWNGSMADWNTIFVAVPAITFNPVKSVNDLLKSEHQS
ncbi:MAG: DUF4301 family protein [Bacteroidota bacterium]